MQTQPAAGGPRYLTLSPAAMAVALAALAFLKGLFAWPLLLLLAHRHMAKWGGGAGPIPNAGAIPMPNPGAMPGHMYGHSMMGHSPLLFLALWLASIVAAAIAGAIFAFIYNAVVNRIGRDSLV